MKTLGGRLIFALGACLQASAQTPGTAILKIDVANYQPYTYDAFDIQKFATAPVAMTLTQPGRAFDFFLFVGDIAAVNGQPSNGLWTARRTTLFFEPHTVP